MKKGTEGNHPVEQAYPARVAAVLPICTAFLGLAFAAPPVAAQGTSPICPTAANVVFFPTPPSPPGPLSSATSVSIRIYSLGYFIAEGIQISGNTISLDARGPQNFLPLYPYTYRPIGVLPAGSYAVTIRPIAVNVTPNVVCPAFTVPLEVAQAYQPVPVPFAARGWLLLLASVITLLGAFRLSRRHSIRRP